MTFWQAPAVLIIVITWFTAPPTSLAELSRREALRRQVMQSPAQTFTNDSLPYMPPSLAQPAPAPPPAAASPEPAPAQAEAQPEEVEERGEEWWRNRAEASRAALERDQVLRDAMQTRVNSLQTDIVNRDDPNQRSLLQQQLTRALNEMERLKQQIEADQQALVDLEADARQQGVPPGWIR